MYAALHRRDRDTFYFPNHQASGVANCRRAWKIGDFFVRDPNCVCQLIRERAKSRAQHERDLRTQLCFRQDEFRGAFGSRIFRAMSPGGLRSSRTHRSITPTIDADIRFAIVPAIMARIPRRASSPFLLGESAPMPPICIPIELKLAKPHSAKVAMVKERGSSASFMGPSR